MNTKFAAKTLLCGFGLSLAKQGLFGADAIGISVSRRTGARCWRPPRPLAASVRR